MHAEQISPDNLLAYCRAFCLTRAESEQLSNHVTSERSSITSCVTERGSQKTLHLRMEVGDYNGGSMVNSMPFVRTHVCTAVATLATMHLTDSSRNLQAVICCDCIQVCTIRASPSGVLPDRDDSRRGGLIDRWRCCNVLHRDGFRE